ILPMADKTGHTSLPEDLAFLRTLRHPPRLTVFHHMGHDDSTPKAMGSLVALLQGLAPQIAATWGYPGMTIESNSLPPRNPVSVLDAASNLTIDVQEKRTVHELGLLHASVLLLVRTAEGTVLVYRRH